MKKFIHTFVSLFLLVYCEYANAQYNNNYSANFNGTDTYLEMPQTTGDMQLHQPFTIEFWMKPKAYAAAGTSSVIFQKADPSTGNGIYISMDDQGLVAVTINNITYSTPAPAVINFWTHIAITYSNPTLVIYFNSSAVNTQSFAAADVYQPYSTYIGALENADGTISNFYKGELDELRIWNIARNAADIETYCRQSFTGMGAAYSTLAVSLPFNNNFNDQGGKEKDTVTNHKVKFIDHTNQNPEYVAYNSSLQVNSNTMFAPDYSDIDATSAVTVEFWERAMGNGYIAVLKGDAGALNYQFEYNLQGNFLRFAYTNSNSVLRVVDKIVPSSVVYTSWSHIAATYKSSTGNLKVYFNGVALVDTVLYAGEKLVPNDLPLEINAYNGCCIDELRIWKNVVRSANQIKEDMFKGYNYTMNPLPSNVVVYDFDGRMDDVMKPTVDSNRILRGINSNYKVFDHFPKASDVYADRNTAPLLRDDSNFFNDNTKYSTSIKRFANFFTGIPQTITDSVFVSQSGKIGDMKMYVFADISSYSNSLNDGVNQVIKLTLISPSGKQIQLTPEYNNSDYLGKTMFCVFDMNAAKKISYADYQGVVLPPFSPDIKPYQSLYQFRNKPMHGWWKLKLDMPTLPSFNYVELYGWGIYPIASQQPEANDLADENLSAEKISNSVSVFPNPFMQSISILYLLQKESNVHISLMDVNGKSVATILNKKDDEAGSYTINFDGSKLSPGIYFCRIENGDKVQIVKIVKQ